jgi:hypothetical protein
MDLYAADVEYSASALEDVYSELESVGRQVYGTEMTDEESAKRKCGICGGKGGRSLVRFPDGLDIVASPNRPFKAATRKWHCPKCAPRVEAETKSILRAQNHERLKTWPDTYRGQIPVNANTERPMLSSDWHREKEAAQRQLLLTAAYLYDECNAVTELSFDKSTSRSGNYRHTTWKASGTPCQVGN